jgi:DNA-binding NtrC family response regulator
MSKAQIAIGESISERDLRGLPSGFRTSHPTMRLERIRAIAGELFEEAESLDRDQAFAEASAMPSDLDLDSGIDFVEEVRRFQIELIKLALNRCNGNQSRAARLLGLGSTTLNYKIKSYEIA